MDKRNSAEAKELQRRIRMEQEAISKMKPESAFYISELESHLEALKSLRNDLNIILFG